jgi:hypothetical protein
MVTPSVLRSVPRRDTLVPEGPNVHRKLFSRPPIEVAKDLAVLFFGEKGEEVI